MTFLQVMTLIPLLVASLAATTAPSSQAAGAAETARDVDAAKLPALVLYVAPAGSDTWTGALAETNAGRTDGPFATLERARDELRKRRKSGAITDGAAVLVRAGTYELTKPFQLTATDSGTAASPVMFRAFPGEKPVLLGGKRITGFKPFKDNIVQVDVAAQGVTIRAPLAESVIVLDKTEHVTIRGFTVECCEGSAVLLRNAKNCLVAACTLRNLGGRSDSTAAIEISNGGSHIPGGRDHTIENNIFVDCGKQQMVWSGSKPPNTLEPGMHKMYEQYKDSEVYRAHYTKFAALNPEIDGPMGGTPEQVREGVRIHIQRLASTGGYIACSSHSIIDLVPPENYLALCKATQDFGITHTRQ